MKGFDAASWEEGARRTDATRETWDAQTHAAAWSEPVTGSADVAVDRTVELYTTQLHQTWFDLIGNVSARLGSDASKMRSTGANYAETEDNAVQANHRFWEET